MKNRTWFLCSVAILVLVLVCADGSLECDTAKQTAYPQKPSCEQSNKIPHVADSARTVAPACTPEAGSEQESRIRGLLSAWAARDAEEALRWVSALENPAAQRSARSIVCFAVAEKDPRRAVTLALAYGADEDDDTGLLECLTMQWYEKEAATVVDWASEQPPGEWRNRLLASATFVLSKSDPTAAAQLVSGFVQGNLQDEAAMAVLHPWALLDSSAALQWEEGFPESTLRDRALAEISNLGNSMVSHE